jgi:hypothetical protein
MITSRKFYFSLLFGSLLLSQISSAGSLIDVVSEGSCYKVGTNKRMCTDQFEKSMGQSLGSSGASSLFRLECQQKNGVIIFSGMLVGSDSTIATSSDALVDEKGNPRSNCRIVIKGKNGRSEIVYLDQTSVVTGPNKEQPRTERKQVSWALVKLKKPLTGISPVEISDPLKATGPTIVVSQNLNRTPKCTTFSTCDRTLIEKSPDSRTTYKMDCELTPGDSGAGVFAKVDGQPKMIGIASSSYGPEDSHGHCYSTFIGLDRNFYEQLRKMISKSVQDKLPPAPSSSDSPGAVH